MNTGIRNIISPVLGACLQNVVSIRSGDSLDNYLSDMAFWSGSFDFEENTWTDKSGNDNDIDILCKYYKGSNWGYVRDNWLTDYGFTSYHEFTLTANEGLTLLGIGASGTSNVYQSLLVTSTTKLLDIFNRAANVHIFGETTLQDGVRYKVLCQWISKDDIKIYIDESETPDLFVENKNYTWNANWDKLGIQQAQNGGSGAYSTGGYSLETKIKAGICGWDEMDSGLSALWHNKFIHPADGESTANEVFLNYDYSGNDRHLLVIAATGLPSVSSYLKGASPELQYGYAVYRKSGSADIHLPLNTDGSNRTVNTALFPFRSEDWQYYANVSGQTTKFNGADIKISFPYNATNAASDAILGDILFTGATPNALIVDDLWDDHLEKHILLFDRTAVDYETAIGTTKDESIRSAKDLILFKSAQSKHVNILKLLGYTTSPTTITAGSLLYRMITANDSFKLSSDQIEAVKLAGLYYMFYCGETMDTPLKTRFADVERINGRNIFCNQSSTLWIYPKPLLPSHLEAALETHLGLTGIENLITTMNEGKTYYSLDYEKLTPVSGVIGFNPSSSADSQYDIFDRRNVAGSAKEIWDADLLAESAYWSWNLSTGVKKINQATVSKFVQAAYSGKLFVRQDWNKDNILSIPYLISFTTPLTEAAKTAMFSFIDFPETFNEPAIVGDGATDDAVAINAAMAANDAVLLYEQDAIILTSVAMTSNTELILADSDIKLGDDINKNIITNSDWDTNENCKLTGYGESVVNGNGVNQDRTANPAHDNLHHYDYIGLLFVNVDSLIVKGIEIQDTMMWGVNTQLCQNVLFEHCRMNQLGSFANQDGIGLGFGTKYGIVRYLNGATNDDYIATLNYLNVIVNPKGTGTVEYLYYRNIYHKYISTGSAGNQTIRIFGHKDADIQNLEYQNIYHYEGASGVLIYFSKSSTRDASTNSTGFVFNNIRGSAIYDFRVFSGSIYSNIVINDLCLDTAKSKPTSHIYITGDNTIITNCEINSKLYYAPTAVYVVENNPTLTNFEHTEEIFY